MSTVEIIRHDGRLDHIHIQPFPRRRALMRASFSTGTAVVAIGANGKVYGCTDIARTKRTYFGLADIRVATIAEALHAVGAISADDLNATLEANKSARKEDSMANDYNHLVNICARIGKELTEDQRAHISQLLEREKVQ